MSPLFDDYQRLWRVAEDNGNVWVHYVAPSGGEGGYFLHDGQGNFKRPEIAIARSFHREPDDEPSQERVDGGVVDLLREYVTLAHEFGHYRSWRAWTSTNPIRWDEYHRLRVTWDRVRDPIGARYVETAWNSGRRELTEEERIALTNEEIAATKKTFSRADIALILEEETRAWDLGRPYVAPHLVEGYDTGRARGLRIYQYRLGLGNIAPSD